MNLPLGTSIAAGIGGIIAAPYAVIPVAIAAVGFQASVELEKKDRTTIDLNGRVLEG